MAWERVDLVVNGDTVRQWRIKDDPTWKPVLPAWMGVEGVDYTFNRVAEDPPAETVDRDEIRSRLLQMRAKTIALTNPEIQQTVKDLVDYLLD